LTSQRNLKGRPRFSGQQKVTSQSLFCTQARILTTATEERKRIAREVRLAARREKKKIKSDAKKQRKQNAILHRRMVSPGPAAYKYILSRPC
jgi:hypothetical protein